MNATIAARLDELRSLRSGWFHARGIAPGNSFIDFVRDGIASDCMREIAPREIIPIVEGGLRLNWFGSGGAVAADIYWPAKIMRVYGVSVLMPFRIAAIGEFTLPGEWNRALTSAHRFCMFGRVG